MAREGRTQNSSLSRAGTIVFITILLIGAVIRLYDAWQLRHNLNPDSGTVAIMARHMAEGTDFPVFFYGQAYMGSLEPLVSALFCALFGTSGFMVTLGTAFVGWLILFVIFAWARDAHSPAAGLAAMAYCIIGPSGFVHYQGSPRGGYMVTILFSALILWLISKLIASDSDQCHSESRLSKGRDEESLSKLSVWRRSIRCAQDDRTRRTYDIIYNYGTWLVLGLLAGLGWWSNQLVVGAIFTAALMALVFFRWKVFSFNTILAATGFFIGSLPFWWWNALHDWRSFEFAGSFGQTPFWQGFKVFFLARLPDLLDLTHGMYIWRIAGTVIYLGAALVTLNFLLKTTRLRQDNRPVFLFTAFVFILVSALLFSTSHFALMNTSRYLLPLVPVIAVVFGVMTAELAGKKPFFLGLIPLAVVIANQAVDFSWLAERGRGEEAYQRQIEECGRFLKFRGITACYTPYGKYAWNFALREEICFCDLPLDRYLPYARRAELADKIAVFDNLGDINNLIANYGGSAKTTYSGSTPICWDFNPPAEGLAAIPVEVVDSIRDSLERDILTDVTDGNIDTGWEGMVEDGDDEWLEIVFKTPQVVRMIRLLYSEYPGMWQVVGQGEDGSWKTLTPCIQTAGYLWSGPRPYWGYGLEGYRLDCKIPPEKLGRLLIHRIQTGYKLTEIQLFSPAAVPASEKSALPDLINVLRGRNLKRLYCDRWPANAVFRETEGKIETWLNPDIFGDYSLATNKTICLTPATALLVREEDALLCRRMLADRLVEMRETKIGPWILFDFSPCEAPGPGMNEPGKWKPEYGRDCELHWAGFGCLAKNSKRWAAELVSRADILAAKGKAEDAIALLQRADKAWPLYLPAIERLAKITARQEQTTGTGYWENEYKKIQPEVRAMIKFNNGVEFAGLSFSTNIVAAGDSLTVRYYWEYPSGGIKGQPWVFVHFLDGKNILQDDHPLEKFKGSEYQPFPERFIETRALVVSEAAPEGIYTVKIGLYDPSKPDQKRFKVKSDLPSQLNSVELPVKLTIKKKRK